MIQYDLQVQQVRAYYLVCLAAATCTYHRDILSFR